MRVAVVTEMGEWSASTRYRASQHVAGLRERLGEVDLLLADDRPRRRPGRIGQARYFASHARRYVGRWAELRKLLPTYDAVLVQRGVYALGPGAAAAPVVQFDGRVVYDVDDALLDIKPAMEGKSALTQWLYGPQQARLLLHRADSLVVSTEVLAAQLSRSTRVPPVVLPTVPDPALYSLSTHPGSRRSVVWAGTVGGLSYLDPLRQVFTDLDAGGRGTLTVVSSAPWQGPAQFEPWSLAAETSSFARHDVGIMPLPDTPFTRGKAGFKLLQYMAAGLPVVASPVGVNAELVERSGAGFVAETAAEWREALEKLLDQPALRRELGGRGRSFVEDYANLSGQADTLAGLLVPSS